MPKQLSKQEKDAIRGMLADKQSAKTIAEQFEVSQEEVEALKKPKAVRRPSNCTCALCRALCSFALTECEICQALSAFMFFSNDHRDAVAAERRRASPPLKWRTCALPTRDRGRSMSGWCSAWWPAWSAPWWA